MEISIFVNMHIRGQNNDDFIATISRDRKRDQRLQKKMCDYIRRPILRKIYA